MSRSSLRKLSGIVVAALLLSSCKPGVPSSVIPPADLEELLYDYHIAQAMAEAGKDSLNFKRYSYVQAVFAKHGVTEAEFDSSMIWYSAHATYLNDIYKRLKERYTVRAEALGTITGEADRFANLDALGDTADIWPERRTYVLQPEFMEDRLLFALAADTSFRKGDALLWRFNSLNISRRRQGEAYAGFYVTYDNDSTIGITRRAYSNAVVELRLNGDTAHNISKVGGFVYFKSSADDNEPRMLLLSDIMLVRFHPQPVVADTVATPAETDSAGVQAADSALRPLPKDSTRRLSPTELRDSRQVERSINVVKEKPYRVVRRPGTTGNRRRD